MAYKNGYSDDIWHDRWDCDDYDSRNYDVKKLLHDLDELEDENNYLQKLNNKLSRDNDRLSQYSESVVKSRITQIEAEHSLEVEELNEKNTYLEQQIAVMQQRLKEAGIENKEQYATPSRKIIKL